MNAPASIDQPIFYGKPLIFKEGSHRYFWDGTPVPSVTTILGRLAKPALIQWSADCAVQHIEDEVGVWCDPHGVVNPTHFEVICKEARKAYTKKRDAAAEVGTFLHDYARRRLANEPVALADADEPTRKVVAAFEKWRSEHDIVPFGLERRTFSRKHWYAGTADFWGTIDGRMCVLDFKTGKAIYDEFWLQTAAYDHALLEEHSHLDRMARWIVRLDKRNGEFQAEMKPPSAVHTECFLHMVIVDNYLRLAKGEA